MAMDEHAEQEALVRCLLHLRREARLSERALARALNCSHWTVWRYEHAVRPIPLDLAEKWVWVCDQEIVARRDLRRTLLRRAMVALDPKAEIGDSLVPHR